MRRTCALLRGSKGYGWYGLFKEQGQQGFKKNIPPTPFDWGTSSTRPKAVLTVKIDKDVIGDLVFELANDVVPKTVENFARLCKGEGEVFKGYGGTAIHMIRKGEFIMGGDIEGKEGQGNHSSYSTRYIQDENFIIPHSSRGLLSMCSVGRDTSGSQFYVDLGVNNHMNGRCVVFGRLVEGANVLDAIEKVFTFKSVPARAVSIEAASIKK